MGSKAPRNRDEGWLFLEDQNERLRNQLAELTAERDRYRAALERIEQDPRGAHAAAREALAPYR